MAKIRHVVYRAADLEAMAKFFVDAFAMTVVRRRPEGGIDLSDGTIHLAVLPVRTAGQRLGFEHIGFMVEGIRNGPHFEILCFPRTPAPQRLAHVGFVDMTKPGRDW